MDQGPAQLPAEAEEQARAEEEEKARRILEETELKSFRLALPMMTKTSREVTSWRCGLSYEPMGTMLGTSIATEAMSSKEPSFNGPEPEAYTCHELQVRTQEPMEGPNPASRPSKIRSEGP